MYVRYINNKNQLVGKDSKNEVCNWICGNNCCLLVDRFIIEGMVVEFWNDWFCVFIQYFDIIVQWDQGDNIFGVEFISLLLECFIKFY